MSAEWVGQVRVEGADEAAEKVGRLQSTTQQTSAAMSGFNRSSHLVSSVLSGNVSGAIAGATSSLRGLWAAFKAAPFITSIGAIAGAVAALVSVIEDRLIKATERYQKMATGFRGSRDMFNEAMGNTPTARAERKVAALVETPSWENMRKVESGRDEAQGVLDAAVKRYRKAVAERDAGAAEYAAQRVADAKAVVDVWSDAWKQITENRRKSEEEARKETERVEKEAADKAAAAAKAAKEKRSEEFKRTEEAKKDAREARHDYLFGKMTDKEKLADVQKRGWALRKGGVTAEEAPEFYRLAALSDSIKERMAAGKKGDAAALLKPEASISTSGGDAMMLFDAMTGRGGNRPGVEIHGDALECLRAIARSWGVK